MERCLSPSGQFHLNQTHSNLELIVVDDHSPRDDVVMYDNLLSDPRIVRLRMPQNVGTYACRNEGLRVMKGAFVTFADSDDWNHPQRLEKAIQLMETRSLDVVGRYVRMSRNGEALFNGGRLSQFSLVTMMLRSSMLRRHNFEFDGRARVSLIPSCTKEYASHLGLSESFAIICSTLWPFTTRLTDRWRSTSHRVDWTWCRSDEVRGRIPTLPCCTAATE